MFPNSSLLDTLASAAVVGPGHPATAMERPSRLRTEFTASPGHAVLTITAYGIYRAFVNGQRVGDHELAPGWQTYHHRHHVQQFDVGDLLVDGTNVLAVELAEGWYRGRLGFGGGVRESYGTEIGVIAAIHAEGSQIVATDESWVTAPSAVLEASLYDGETWDQRLEDDWASVGHDTAGWAPAKLLDVDTAPLLLQPCPPVRQVQAIAPVSIFSSPSGATLVDFGQNLVGFLRVELPAVPDLALTFRHAEVLEHGELGVRPLRVAKATDVVHTSGAGGSWQPAFTFHGFRYAEVSGWPGELTAADLTAVVLQTDMEEIGSFHCSDPLLDRLHENARWGGKGNFVSVPTDCPQRDERLGWTGDLQVFTPTAAFLFDCRSFLSSWLQDLAADQREADGIVPMIVPSLPKVTPVMPFAGWADAAVVVPWVLYERFGARDVLAAQYESMRSWVDAVASQSREDGLWIARFQLGDWLDPAAPPDNPAKGRTDAIMVGVAYQVHVVRLLAQAAQVLGHTADADRYRERGDALAEAFRAEYVTPNGRLMSDSPTAYALALRFGLLTASQRSVAEQRLLQLVEGDGFHIGTGFLGTPVVLDALADISPDHAFRLLMQTECPSWLYSVSMGATTIWERWDSMLPDGSINPGEMTSFNHYAFGCVADFLHRRVAGLAPAEPGYRVIEVRPLLGGGLTSASATHRTPQGPASVAWTLAGNTFSLDMVVPDGCTARVSLPDGSPTTEVGAGRHHFACDATGTEQDVR